MIKQLGLYMEIEFFLFALAILLAKLPLRLNHTLPYRLSQAPLLSPEQSWHAGARHQFLG